MLKKLKVLFASDHLEDATRDANCVNKKIAQTESYSDWLRERILDCCKRKRLQPTEADRSAA
ncbi:MAG: hypothetical protein ABSH36_01555 [Solirubrobacteraceae bacterium]